MSPRCPEMGLACSTAYGKGCRCKACRVARQRAYDRRAGKIVDEEPVEPTVKIDLHELVRLADAAFRVDFHYAEQIAMDYYEQHPVRK